MLDRLKKDKITFEKRANHYKEQLERQKQAFDHANKDSSSTNQYNFQTQKVLDDMVRVNIEIK